jgi:hypothetical protein
MKLPWNATTSSAVTAISIGASNSSWWQQRKLKHGMDRLLDDDEDELDKKDHSFHEDNDSTDECPSSSILSDSSSSSNSSTGSITKDQIETPLVSENDTTTTTTTITASLETYWYGQSLLVGKMESYNQGLWTSSSDDDDDDDDTFTELAFASMQDRRNLYNGKEHHEDEFEENDGNESCFSEYFDSLEKVSTAVPAFLHGTAATTSTRPASGWASLNWV